MLYLLERRSDLIEKIESSPQNDYIISILPFEIDGKWYVQKNNLNKSVSPRSLTRLNGSTPPPGTQRHQNNAMHT